MAHINDTSISLRASHDLRGPLINIQGFSGEISTALEKICDLTETHQATIPAEYQQAFDGIVNDDLRPCLEYLNSAIALLEDRIRKLRTIGAIDIHGGSVAER